jgi:8-oxo-dGTP pyrophosphatase MutT (NUDIX family)
MTRSCPDPQPIRDAACVVLFDANGGEPRLLLGKRRETQVFLPNKWVFPGGRVDDEDRVLAETLQSPGDLPGQRARTPFLVAAMRELYEEAGLLIGSGELEAEGAFHAERVRHVARHLTPLARAITPPGRPRRFDTWFFLAPIEAASAVKPPDGELLNLGWFTLKETLQLDLPTITRFVVEDVASSLTRGASTAEGPFPFYFQGPERYERQLISDAAPPHLF